ncbi:MAG: flagellar hook-basal body complex protein, partial [Magnetovibrio sp.]|nr:flagellar hook-basal body complex protein [Magnetovibrio sp.]
DTLTTVQTNLIGQITADGTLSPLVTPSTNGTDGINLLSTTAGVAYTLTTAVVNAGGAPGNTATSTTANYTAIDDNTASTTTTTASVSGPVLTFKDDGTLASPTTLTLAATFDQGATSSAAIDISKMTQFYGDFLPLGYTKDGFASSSMRSFGFDSSGNVLGTFEDNTVRPIYKLALGVFSNPNALQAVNGNVFKSTNDSGGVTITTAGSEGYATFMPNARELSNVDIADEFSKMMMTQTAYNAASTVFRTTDEMVTVARDLKR